MMQPKAFSAAIVALRRETLQLFDELRPDEHETVALPGWTVDDVFRHLADSDRGSVLGRHLLEFLPSRDLEVDFQAKNDRNLERLRGRGSHELRAELETWGRRVAALVRRVPARVGMLRIPTAFGRLPLTWMAGLRLYDEWVHQLDIARALGRPQPPMSQELAALLGPWQLAALEADAIERAHGEGIVQVVFTDAPETATYDLAASGDKRTSATPTAYVTTDVGSWCLLAADRVSAGQLVDDGAAKLEGDRQAALALLDVVRVV